MIKAIFKFIVKSGPGMAIAGAVLILVIAMMMGLALSVIQPYILLFVGLGVFLSILWAIVFILTKRHR